MKPLTSLLALLTTVNLWFGPHGAASAGEALMSQRLGELQKQTERGNADAPSQFWQTVANEGAPLVETIQDDADHAILTFLWRDRGDTRNVILYSVLTTRPNMDFTESQLARSHLKRLAETDVWYRSFRIRRDARLSYYLSHNDTLLPAAQRKADGDWSSLRPDPLNPNTYVLSHAGRDWVRSIVDLPDAAPVPWVEPQKHNPAGRVEEHRLASSSLKNERRFWVYTPHAYPKGKPPFRLLVMFDGWRAVHMDPTVTVLDNLQAAGRIQPMVAVMVEQQDRMLELGCHEPFDLFLVDELLPWVRENYHVSDRPALTIVAGVSAGGLGAVCAGWRHPDVFGNVMSQSGYFSWDPLEASAAADAELEWEWIIRKIAAGQKANIRLALSVGMLEHDHDFLYSPSILNANRHLRDVLRAKGYAFAYQEVAGGHDVYSAAMTFPDLLIAMSDLMRQDADH